MENFIHCCFKVEYFIFAPLPPQVYSMESPVVIFDALAGHVHQVQVRAHDDVNNESQWSDWSPLLLAQPWEGQTDQLTS